jgi:hypothetical protein
MTDNFIRNRIGDLERLQESFAEQITDRTTKGPERMELVSKVIVHLEFARELLRKEIAVEGSAR